MEISELLLENEFIEWSFTKQINLFEKIIIRYTFRPFIIIIGPLLLIMFLSLLLSWTYLFSATLILVFILGFYILFRFNDYFRIKRKFRLSKSELRSYHVSIYLTNKRIIQKSYEILNLEFKNFPNYELREDFFILNHEDIRAIIISYYKNRYKIWLSGTKANTKYIRWENYTSFEIPEDKYDNFYKILKKYIPLDILDNSIENVIRYTCFDN
ncbi:MAG: hypothetical protein GF317_21840 [Candidatus Lokiarchaeota archaeon]|nr:hypothetical protein [Candidatus Lokiarchaeota archaeon]MBD3202104.1 hypothetical protein [Candidatus Lokiarchaeota archaeon]